MDKEEIKKHYEEALERKKKLETDPEFRKQYWIDYCSRIKPFTMESWCEPPVVNDEKIYKEIIVPCWIKNGAIPKKDLIRGKIYQGHCRNSSIATWIGDKFVYTRFKFDIDYEEEINHFEDYTEYDVFVPLKILEENEIDTTKG